MAKMQKQKWQKCKNDCKKCSMLTSSICNSCCNRPRNSHKISRIEVCDLHCFHWVTESVRHSSSLVSSDVSEGAGRPPGARGSDVELAHRRTGLVHAGEGQRERACKIITWSNNSQPLAKCYLLFNNIQR